MKQKYNLMETRSVGVVVGTTIAVASALSVGYETGKVIKRGIELIIDKRKD